MKKDLTRSGSADEIQKKVVEDLFGLFESLCEGAISVDRQARIVWINDKYRELLGVRPGMDVVGRDVEDIIPQSLMRQVVETGQPILLDIMRFSDQHFVVSRLPLLDCGGSVIGAVGFVLYDRVDQLKPLIAKFERLQSELTRTRRELEVERRARYSFSNFIGNSPPAQAVKRLARRAAQTGNPVLLLGETGTGKELLAQAIHAASSRASGPFIAVNASAIPENLLEAEFFGSVPGAFTGAGSRPRDGKLKLADGGSLFLDEIGDMPQQVQVKMLRVLEEQLFEPLGSNKLIKVDVRLIAATGFDLVRAVETGQFRRDLFYRLNVLTILVPPLRERLDDIAPICEALLESHARAVGQPQLEIEPEALALLKAYAWPGNVRELRNVLERACLSCDRPLLTAETIKSVLPEICAESPKHVPGPLRPLAEALAEREREVISTALREAGGRKALAARLLGISRSRLYVRMDCLRMS